MAAAVVAAAAASYQMFAAVYIVDFTLLKTKIHESLIKNLMKISRREKKTSARSKNSGVD